MGDFNNMLAAHEKRGGRPQPPNLIRGFQEAIVDASLYDLPMLGYKFTWEHGRGGLDWMEEKLDRILMSTLGRSLFSQSRAQVLELSSSDHLPIYLEVMIFIRRAASRKFCFENSWLKEVGCRDIVLQCWNQEDDDNISSKLHHWKEKLYQWDADLRQLYKAELQESRTIMTALRGSHDLANVRKFLDAKCGFYELLHEREIHWKQRAKEFWLTEGDLDMRFFHEAASQQHRQNKIERLQDENCE